jgi:hypothetical protein
MRTRILFLLLGLAALLGLLLALDPRESAERAVAVPLPAGLSSASLPRPMPAFDLPGINISSLQSGELLGKVIVLRFWATH